MPFFDAHNHLQDPRLGSDHSRLIREAQNCGVQQMVVNGSCEEDWPAVLDLARRFPEQVVPSFGYHPWYIAERSKDYLDNLQSFLTRTAAGVGEIGLDRWKEGLAYEGQESVFLDQLSLAAERELPVSIHCLKTWGRLYDLLRQNRRPACGFLLHSYGGPPEMIPGFVKLGAYFSFPGYFAQERKLHQRETFRLIPIERILVETDAPDQPLPADRVRVALQNQQGKGEVNHPANLGAVYEFLADWLTTPLEALSSQVEQNFKTLFAPILRPPPPLSKP